MSQLILHIGTHKTGTTSLQAFLRANRQAFAQQDIGIPYEDMAYRVIDKDRNGHFLLRSVLDTLNPKRAYPEDERFIAKGVSAFQESAEKHSRVLLSDEALWYQGAVVKGFWPELKRQLEKLGVDQVKVVVYLRRQDQFIASLWNQFVKGATREGRTLEVYAGKKRSRLAMDYDRSIHQLETEFGSENIVVRRFDRNAFVNGDLYHDFCDAIGCPYTDEFVVPEVEANESLDSRFVEIKRLMNQSPRYQEGQNIFKGLLLAVQDASPHKNKGSVLGGSAAAAIVARYDEGNRRIAHDYLGIEDGPLFPPVNEDEPKYDPGITSSQEDLIVLLAEAFAYEDARITKLEKENAQLKKQLGKAAPARSSADASDFLHKVKRKLDRR